jgi:hypothetical protein
MREPHCWSGRHGGQDAVEAALGASARFLSCLLICLAALTAGPASAETSARCLTDAWVIEARQFVAEQAGSPVPEVCVRFAGSEQLAALVPSAAAGRAHDEAIAAVFVPAKGEILLADDLDPSTALARSYLVHELVHAQQFATDKHRRISCLGSLEGEAYAMQAVYLRTAGFVEDAFLLQVLGVFQSACGYNY